MTGTQNDPMDGSHLEVPGGARPLGKLPDDTVVHFDLVLRRRVDGRPSLSNVTSSDRAEQRDQYARVAGASRQDLDLVQKVLQEAGFIVLSSSAVARTISASGASSLIQSFFGVELQVYAASTRHFRGRAGKISLPSSLTGIVVAVLGLDNRPQVEVRATPPRVIHPESLPPAPGHGVAPDGSGEEGSLDHFPGVWAPAIAKKYEFPEHLNGHGQTIALLQFGGGFTQADLHSYFTKLGVDTPNVISVPVDGYTNSPGSAADQEVVLDIDIAGSIAPGARLVTYFAESSSRGFLQALVAAIHDEEHAPTVISISWGAYEESWTPQSVQAMDMLFEDAAALGVTVIVAAGDHGAADGVGDGHVHVDYPASSPFVLACGGTMLAAGTRLSGPEVVWNNGNGWATGGGISKIHKQPSWQLVQLPESLADPTKSGRGVPDVAGYADGGTGYIVALDGQWCHIGGNSAVAPLYAALIARIKGGCASPIGSLAPLLYAIPDTARSDVFSSITMGNNSVPSSPSTPPTTGYTASPGWNACTGLGTIRGDGLLAWLSSQNPISEGGPALPARPI